MNTMKRALLCAAVLALPLPAMAQITFYEGEGFRGRAFVAKQTVQDFGRSGFNDRAASALVERGRWEVCEHSRFGGNCVVLGPGSYANLQGMRLTDRISSTRPVSGRRDDARYVPAPMARPDYDYRRRPEERVYEAQVTSVRAVLARGGERCWIEHDQYERQRGSNAPGRAIAGAIIGAVIGHQIGSGSGRDVATVGGAVAGAAIGARSARDDRGYERGVQRCETVRGEPQYWDVSYEYRGVEHWARMSDPPGRTLLVNRRGEPRQ
jgi:uncharacterized protein YcfJ